MRRHLYLSILIMCLYNTSPIQALPIAKSVKIVLTATDETHVGTHEIQSAIDSCHQVGGGTVVFSSGIFLTGSIQLKSNVMVYIESGATIKGSSDLNDYPFHNSSHPFGPDDMKMRSLIWADGAENISICGSGIIDGSGESPQFDVNQQPRPIRPMVMRLISCKNTLIEGITLKSSPMWMQQYVNCEQLQIRNIIVFNHSNRNNDGLDIVGCREVQVAGCNISSDDDALCFKTLSDAENKNIIVTNCILASNCNALKIGTETSANNSDIIFSNCIIKKTGVFSKIWKRDTGMAGLAIESVDGADINNVLASGLVITGVRTPLFIRLGNRGRKYAGSNTGLAPGSIRNVMLSNITGIAESSPGNIISGIKGHPIENVQLYNISFTSNGGGLPEHLSLKVPEKEKEYPEVTMFGKILPSYGLYVRYVNGLKLDHIDFRLLQKDVRPAMVLDQVSEAVISNYYADTQETADCLLRLINNQHIELKEIRTNLEPQLYLRIEGQESNQISLWDSYKNVRIKKVNFEDTHAKETFKLLH